MSYRNSERNSSNNSTKKTEKLDSLIKKLCKTKKNKLYFIKKINKLLKGEKKQTKKDELGKYRYVAFNIERKKYFNNLEQARKYVRNKNKKEKIKKWKIRNNQTYSPINI
jgi:hypothetical protein